MPLKTDLVQILDAGRSRTIGSSDPIKVTAGIDGTPIGPNAASTGAFTTLASSALSTLNSLSVTGDASVDGSLTVVGDIISRGAVNLVVEDNFIDLNFGNTTVTAESGGITVAMNRTAGFTAGSVTTFVAGNAGVSNPTFTNADATGSTALAIADIVMISGSTTASNDGLYQVTAVSGAGFPQTVTIAGIGTTAVDGSLPFCQNQFTADTGDTANATKVDLAVWAVADGTNNFLQPVAGNYSKGTFITAYATGAVLSDFDGAGDYTTAQSTLQSAYDGGNALTTAGTNPVIFNLGADAAGFSVQGAAAGDGDVSIGGGTAVNSYQLNASGAASVINSTEQALTLKTTTSGTLNVTGAALMNVTSGGAATFGTTGKTIDVSAAGVVSDTGITDYTLTPGATTSISGGTTVDISGGGAVTLNSTASTIAIGSNNTTSIDINAATSAAAVDLQIAGASYLAMNGTNASLDAAKSLVFTTKGTAALPSAATAVILGNGSGATINKGKICALDTDGEIILADCNAGAPGDAVRTVMGAPLADIANSQAGPVCVGGLVPVFCAADGDAITANIGKPVYLTATAGAVASTAPTAAGNTVYQVGILQAASTANLAYVVWAPQFIADIIA